MLSSISSQETRPNIITSKPQKLAWAKEKKKSFTPLLFLMLIFGNTPLFGQGFKAHFTVGTNISDDYGTESGNSQVGTRMGIFVYLIISSIQ